MPYLGLLHPETLPPQQSTADPCLHWRLLDTHGQVWVSLLWGHCSLLLRPGAHRVLFVPSMSLFPQSCVSSSGSMMGLMSTSSKRAYAICHTQAAPEHLSLPQATADPYLHRKQTLKGRSGSVSRFSWCAPGMLGP